MQKVHTRKNNFVHIWDSNRHNSTSRKRVMTPKVLCKYESEDGQLQEHQEHLAHTLIAGPPTLNKAGRSFSIKVAQNNLNRDNMQILKTLEGAKTVYP